MSRAEKAAKAFFSAANRKDMDAFRKAMADFGEGPFWHSMGLLDPLALAVVGDFPEAVDWCLRSGAPVDGSEFVKPALSVCAEARGKNRLECARMLVEAGASVDPMDRDGEPLPSPLLHSILIRDEDMVEYLVSVGADPVGAKPGYDGSALDFADAGTRAAAARGAATWEKARQREECRRERFALARNCPRTESKAKRKRL